MTWLITLKWIGVVEVKTIVLDDYFFPSPLAATILKVEGHMSIAQLQKFLRHDNQKTTEIYAGFLDASTQEQGDFLGDFWSKKLAGLDSAADTGE